MLYCDMMVDTKANKRLQCLKIDSIKYLALTPASQASRKAASLN